jgi:hypothetical protein
MLPDKIPVTTTAHGWLQFSILNVFIAAGLNISRSIPAFLLEQNVYFIFSKV